MTTLESFQNTKATKDGVTMADPCKMFNRLITIASREDDLEPMFKYELTFEPMSLFKVGLMRKPDKPALRNVIVPGEDAVKKNSIKGCKEYVLAGGALLHRVRWSKGMKFNDIAEASANYIRKHYKTSVTVVFDGYHDEGTKSQEHLRRNLVSQSYVVEVHGENQVPFTQDRLLSNIKNKANFLHYLSEYLSNAGYATINCAGDTDSTIVKTALTYAEAKSGIVTVVADDTDIAVMLVHHLNNNMSDMYFLQERWSRAWSIKTVSMTNTAIKSHLLFLHARSGCDTVSSVFGKGKATLPEALAKSVKLKEISETMCSPWSNSKEVGDASIKAFVLLYGGKENTTLAQLS